MNRSATIYYTRSQFHIQLKYLRPNRFINNKIKWNNIVWGLNFIAAANQLIIKNPFPTHGKFHVGKQLYCCRLLAKRHQSIGAQKKRENRNKKGNQIKIQLNSAQQFPFHSWNSRFQSINFFPAFLSASSPIHSCFVDHPSPWMNWNSFVITILQFKFFSLRTVEYLTM